MENKILQVASLKRIRPPRRAWRPFDSTGGEGERRREPAG
jgi:hypothetical protein